MSNKSKQLIIDKNKAVEARIPGAIYRVSKRKVPYVFIKLDWTVCYFARSNKFRIFHKHFKEADVASVDEVVQFFENLDD